MYCIGAEIFFAKTETLFFFQILLIFLLLGVIQVFISLKRNLALPNLKVYNVWKKIGGPFMIEKIPYAFDN